MAWTDPSGHVWTTGEVVTAANMNTYIKDDLIYLGTPPSARVWHSANQSVTTSGTPQTLNWDTEQYKTDSGMHSTVTNNSRLTATLAGKYLLVTNLLWAANATGVRGALIRLNGTASTWQGSDLRGAFATDNVRNNCSALWSMALNDYFEVQAYQTSGGALNVTTSQAETWFAMAWQGF